MFVSPHINYAELKNLKDHIPFELKRGTSIISIIIALIIVGLFNEVGKLILSELIIPFIPKVWNTIIVILSYTVEINLLGLFVFVVLLFPIYRLIDKKLLNRKEKEIIFQDSNFKTWNLNYWESHNPTKTNRIEDSRLVFEAQPNELVNPSNRYGAFFDLSNGIYEGNEYKVECLVRSEPNSTMKFQLWLHDSTGNNESKFPTDLETPPTKNKLYSAKFRATNTNVLRIHLHNEAGSGKTYVENVKVYKV